MTSINTEVVVKEKTRGGCALEIQEDEINLLDIWKVIVKRRNLIISIASVSAIVALVVSLLLPKVYEGEAVVNLPKSGGTTISGGTIISSVETKAIIDLFLKELKKGNATGGIDDGLAKKIDDVKVEQITGTDFQLKMIVRICGEPQRAYEVFNSLIVYLNGNEYVKRRLAIEKATIESNITETKNAIANAMRTREKSLALMAKWSPISFNPVDLDIRISELNTKVIGFENSLSLLKSFEYVSGPYVYKNKVKPKVALNTVIAGIIGIFAGLILSFVLEINRKEVSTHKG